MNTGTIVNGAVAGLVATAPMTAVMEKLFAMLPPEQQYPLPPSQITERVEQGALNTRLPDEQHTTLTLANHFLYGAAAGALYGAVAQNLRFSPALKGMLFGLGVWTASYQGWVPAAGILPPASETPGERNALMITANILWGAVTGVLLERMEQGQD